MPYWNLLRDLVSGWCSTQLPAFSSAVLNAFSCAFLNKVSLHLRQTGEQSNVQRLQLSESCCVQQTVRRSGVNGFCFSVRQPLDDLPLCSTEAVQLADDQRVVYFQHRQRSFRFSLCACFDGAAHLFAKGDVATSNVQNVELLRNVLRHCRNASVTDALWSSGSFRKPNDLESSVFWVSKAVFARLGVVRRVQANGCLLVTALCFLSSVDVSEFYSGLFPITQSKTVAITEF